MCRVYGNSYSDDEKFINEQQEYPTTEETHIWLESKGATMVDVCNEECDYRISFLFQGVFYTLYIPQEYVDDYTFSDMRNEADRTSGCCDAPMTEGGRCHYCKECV